MFKFLVRWPRICFLLIVSFFFFQVVCVALWCCTSGRVASPVLELPHLGEWI